MSVPEGRSRAPRGAKLARRPWPAGSDGKRRAALILEVLAGLRTPADAAGALSLSLPRYYLLEGRAVAALVASCEPAQRGPRVNEQRRIAALERQVAHLQRESDRYQALARMAQRSLGLPAPEPAAVKKGADAKGRRRRKATVRALTMAKALRQSDSSGTTALVAVEQPPAAS